MPATHSPDAAAVGRRITPLRQARGWSLSTLAARAGIGKGTLSELESGTRNPTLETLYAVAAALGVPLVDLIGRHEAASAASPQLHGAAVSARLVESYDEPEASIEVYRLAIRPGQSQVSPGHGAGVTEHLVVTSGTVLVGPVEAPVEISAGEHACWLSEGDHRYECLSATVSEAVLVIFHPRPRRDGRSGRPRSDHGTG